MIRKQFQVQLIASAGFQSRPSGDPHETASNGGLKQMLHYTTLQLRLPMFCTVCRRWAARMGTTKRSILPWLSIERETAAN